MQAEDFLPKIHSLVRSVEIGEGEPALVPPLFLLSFAQFEDSLGDIEIVETPLTRGPALAFFPTTVLPSAFRSVSPTTQN